MVNFHFLTDKYRTDILGYIYRGWVCENICARFISLTLYIFLHPFYFNKDKKQINNEINKCHQQFIFSFPSTLIIIVI